MAPPRRRNPALGLVKIHLLLSVLCVSWLLFLPPPPRTPPTPGGTRAPPPRNVTVLLWYWPFNKPFSLGGDVCWDLYRVPRCRLLAQRSLFAHADVVVFHHAELARGGRLPLPLPRPPHQSWAWMSLEAPAPRLNLRRFANLFNMTVSYRRDADVPIPYGELRPRAPGAPPSPEPPPTANKTSLACWVVSNYRGRQRRSGVYRELKDAIPVRVYGRWGGAPLAPQDLLPAISRCYFYLAFENAASRDYITEKLWRNAYQGGAVPVVLGPPPADYEAVAPPHSFIHVDDFASAAELAAHLRGLAADGRRYGEFFGWRRRWGVRLLADWRERLCAICTHFARLPPRRVYADLHRWVTAGPSGPPPVAVATGGARHNRTTQR